MVLKKGYFISFEGIEGSGKSTCLEHISKVLNEKNIPHITTREPGGTNYSEGIRKLLLSEGLDPITEALGYASARRDHLLKVIKPAVDEKKIVICDRYIDSSFIYQTVLKDLSIKDVIQINKMAIGSYFPNITFIFSIDPKAAQERLFRNKKREINFQDKKDINFHNLIDKGYKRLGKMFPKRIVFIDASINRTKEQIVDDILNIMQKKLKIWKK